MLVILQSVLFLDERKNLIVAQLNYAIIEKEMFSIVYAFDKFREYLLGSKTIVYTNHSAIKNLG